MDSDRSDWLRQALLEHERAALARDPALVAAKYSRMARTKFAFFRGTAWLAPREPSRFAPAAAAQVAVMGDPHPENVGTFFDERGQRHIEFNDFDLAGFGSYLDDLRRLAVSLWIVADMADLKHKQRPRVVDELVTGYLAELRGLGAGKPPVALRADSLSGDLEEILADRDDEAKDEAASPEEKELARQVLAALPPTLYRPPPLRGGKSLAIKQVTRRNAGIASFPVLRLRVVVEGPTDAAGDDWTLELKESSGAPAAQVVPIQRQFQETPDLDPLLGWGAAGRREFRVRQVRPGERRLDVERLVKQMKSPRWGKRDLKDLAQALGRLLARGHARALARDGHPALPTLLAAVGDDDGLRREIATYAEQHATANTTDFHLFQRLLATRGPLLGWVKGP